MTTDAEALERARKSYDETPYTSSPLVRAQPARMAATARWFGLDAPDAARGRVLEIGCASGGHLLPLAARAPEAFHLGVDLSPAQIAAGEARRRALGLDNVALRAGSFTDLSAADGAFDFIVCHGVYSWIPEPLRDALLRVVAERLAPGGLAFVSLNVLPGWRLYQIARDAMIAHAGAIADPALRAREARRLFAVLAETAPADSAYGAFWRREAQRMAAGDDGYLNHEIFEEDNAPETFDHLADRLEAHGLAYLSESAVAADGDEALPPEAAAAARALAGDDPRARVRILDIVTGRSFREALIVHGERLKGGRGAGGAALDELHIVAPPDFAVRRAPEGGQGFVAGRPEGGLAIEDDSDAAALQRLAARLPASSRLDDLGGRASLRESVARLVAQGHLDLSTLPVACAPLGARPRIWSLVATDARAGEATATLRHAAYRLAPFERLLAPWLDGTRTRADLVAFALSLADEGRLRLPGPAGTSLRGPALRAHLDEAVERTLRNFAAKAMLVG